MAITADNIAYFGDPVYEYEMAQGIKDGYLAAGEIIRGRVNLDDTGITRAEIMKLGPRDPITGRLLTREQVDALYRQTSYEGRILLPDRKLAMAQDLFDYLATAGNPEQKTIIFCVNDRHAEEIAILLNNFYAKWCQQRNRKSCEHFAFKCTNASSGNDMLPDFRSSSIDWFIATTVDLLTTGVDVPRVRNIVFFRYMKSPIAFYQMVGRGTRLFPFTYKQSTWLNAMPADAAATIRAIVSQFERGGTEELENRQIWRVPEVSLSGGMKALGALGKPADILRDTKARVFAA